MDNKIKVYVKLDENNVVVDIQSSVFLDNTENWIKIDEGYGDKYALAQTHYLSKWITDENGIFNYKYEDKLIELTDEEKRQYYPKNNDEKAIQEEKLNNMMLMSMRASLLNEIPDEQAVEVPLMFTSWNDYEDGYTFKVDERVEYNGNLWKVKKEHKKQADWYPGADPTLFVQLDKDEHKGTIDDPIPVPSSVTTSGFEYVVGKYYLEGGNKYLCKRQGMSDGETIQLFFAPSSLVGHYFEKV